MTNDQQSFEMSDQTARRLGKLMEAALDDTDPSDGIPLSTIDSSVLQTILDLLDKRLDARQLDVRRMISVMEAANFLNNQMLIDELAPLVADHIRGKTAEQIRDMLGLEDDFTEEERREIEKEQAWFLQQDSILN